MFCLVRSSTYKNRLYQGGANPQLGWRQTYDLESFPRAFEDFCHSPSPCQRRMGIFNAREVTIIVHRQLFFFSYDVFSLLHALVVGRFWQRL